MTSFLGIDIGTSSIKAVLIDERQRILAGASSALKVLRPNPLWSDETLRQASLDGWNRLRAIGLSGQQHGATLLGSGGEALRPCILWNDGRSQAECAELAARRARMQHGNAKRAAANFSPCS